MTREQVIEEARQQNWRTKQAVLSGAMRRCRIAEKLSQPENVLHYLRHVLSCGGVDSTPAEKQYARAGHNPYQLKLSPEWAQWKQDERAYEASLKAPVGDDGPYQSFLNSDD